MDKSREAHGAQGAGCPCCQTRGNKERTMPHDDKTIKELINRIKRIEGQLRGIRGMIERREYCDNVLNQIASANAALRGTARVLLEKHLKVCVKEQLQSGDNEVVDEVLNTVFRMMK